MVNFLTRKKDGYKSLKKKEILEGSLFLINPWSSYLFIAASLFCFSVLAPNLTINAPLGYGLTFSQASLFLLGGYIFSSGDFKINKTAGLFFLLVFFHGLISLLMIRGELSINFLVQFAIVTFGFFVMYNFVRLIGLERSLHIIAFISIVGGGSIVIEQVFSFLGGEGSFGRKSGILREPSEASYIVVPGFYLLSRWEKRWSAALTAVGVILTFSATTYIAFLVSLALLFYRKLKYLGAVLLLPVLGGGVFVFLNLPWVGERLQSLPIIIDAAYQDRMDFHEISSYGGSIGTLILSAKVAWGTMLETSFWGVGFGDFRSAFSKQFNVTQLESFNNLLSQSKSGGSLLFRFITEMGILGALLLFFLVGRMVLLIRRISGVKNNKNRKINYYYDSISVCLVVLAAYFTRKDLYFDPMFLGSMVIGYLGIKGAYESTRRRSFVHKDASGFVGSY